MIIAYENGGGATICKACGRYVELDSNNCLQTHQRWNKDKAKRICRLSGKHWMNNKIIIRKIF